ncbi:hypothetical protein VPNG_09838 [Cytospora leucostoma]|uniref:DUF6546 domain-containing protein n=1 Tax=Cytospora leucostoma TaxID=1230097 RepID=A0A423VIR5_9PEZI|nr:hypothetical protein VPNG_09838 [Cytospora leucostoma]
MRVRISGLEFFGRLSEAAPKLKELCVQTWEPRPMGDLSNAAIELSQRLVQMDLEIPTSELRSLFTPYWDGNFDPESPPALAWPRLTHLILDAYGLAVRSNCEKNGILMALGRALRQMPRLQLLKLEAGWYCHVSFR